MRSAAFLAALAALAASAACSPTLDWRTFEPEGSGVTVSFPCRPDRHVRNVPLAGGSVRMELLSCSAGDTTFALSFADLDDPSRIGPALAELRTLAVGNIGATAPVATPVQVAGMTPSAEAVRVALNGRRPDGSPIEQQAIFFTRGLRIYQASVVGTPVAPEAASTFLGAPAFAR